MEKRRNETDGQFTIRTRETLVSVEPLEERVSIGESTQISHLVAGTQISSLLEKKHLDPKVWGLMLRRYIEGEALSEAEYNCMKARVEQQEQAAKERAKKEKGAPQTWAENGIIPGIRTSNTSRVLWEDSKDSRARRMAQVVGLEKNWKQYVERNLMILAEDFEQEDMDIAYGENLESDPNHRHMQALSHRGDGTVDFCAPVASAADAQCNRFTPDTQAMKAQKEAIKCAGLEHDDNHRDEAMNRNIQLTLPDASWQKLRKTVPKPEDHKDCEWLREKSATQKFIRNKSGTRSPGPHDPAKDHAPVRILRRHKHETRFAPAWVWVQHNAADGEPPPGASEDWESLRAPHHPLPTQGLL